jgi:cytochrome d ubiquinol oxidase subunit II
MSWAAVVFLPVILLYQGWTYWVFRKRVMVERIPVA